jgi:surfactin synthase thioesterase subunit/phosphopantetheinyl transferase
VSTTSALDAWCPTVPSTPDVRTLLFCLPHAGGSAYAFRGLAAGLPPGVGCVPVHLPGRESRLDEPPAIDVVELARAVGRCAGDRPFALFGHSMGARLAFEAARQLRRDGAPAPVLLVASGCRPPHLDVPLSRVSHLPDDELCARVEAMGGTTPGTLAVPELRELLLPVLRSDFAMVEAYRFRPEPPLDVPIVVLAGAADPEADALDMTGWSAHTSASTHLYTLPGDHFFVHSALTDVLRIVAAELGAPAAPHPLDQDEICLVEARLDALPELCGARGELSASESRTAAGLADPTDRDRFTGTRVLLRRTLRAFGADPGTAELARGPGGKPALAHPSGLRFSVARERDVALVAVAPGREVGVAVERLAPLDGDPAAPPAGLSTAEWAEVAGLADDEIPGAVARLRTAGQAVRRAAGETRPAPAASGAVPVPERVEFADRDSRPWRAASPGRLGGWRVHHVDLTGAVGALATGPGPWRLRYRSLPGGPR